LAGNVLRDIYDAKFYLIINKGRDEFKRDQILVIRFFFYKNRFYTIIFFDIIHVKNISALDISALTFKKEISYILSHHNLDIQNIRD